MMRPAAIQDNRFIEPSWWLRVSAADNRSDYRLRPAFRFRPRPAFFAALRAPLREALRADFLAPFFLPRPALFFLAPWRATGAAARFRAGDELRARAPPEGRPGAWPPISSSASMPPKPR